MSVRYRGIDNESVSDQWYQLLRDIRYVDNVRFNVNEGHRTMARQWFFWRIYQNGGNIAAFPSPFAPHIRSGRFDHAIDFNNAQGVMDAARRRGVTLTRTVRWPNGTVREEWHLEANAGQLQAYYNKHHFNPPRTLKKGNRGRAVRKLKRRLRKHGMHVPRTILHRSLFTGRIETAVKRFQRRHHLKADGIVGYSTWRALLR